jgi:hypothetical protein
MSAARPLRPTTTTPIDKQQIAQEFKARAKGKLDTIRLIRLQELWWQKPLPIPQPDRSPA